MRFHLSEFGEALEDLSDLGQCGNQFCSVLRLMREWGKERQTVGSVGSCQSKCGRFLLKSQGTFIESQALCLSASEPFTEEVQ